LLRFPRAVLALSDWVCLEQAHPLAPLAETAPRISVWPGWNGLSWRRRSLFSHCINSGSRRHFAFEAPACPSSRASVDGEVVCCDERGLATFQLLRHRPNEPRAFLYAFDLLKLNGTDLRREPIEVRKATLASILRKSRPGCAPGRAPGALRGRCRLPARLQDGAGGDCLEAAGVALPIGAIDRLAQVQESGCTGGAARGRRGLVSLINTGAIGCVAFKAPSQNRSGFRSPASTVR
jgi:hypothetical protein